MVIQRRTQFATNGELLCNLCLLKRISVVTIVTVTCSVTYNGKFRYSLAWRCLKATIILRLICIIPSASHVNHFDKLNSNGLRFLSPSFPPSPPRSVSIFLFLSTFDCTRISAGSFDLLFSRADRLHQFNFSAFAMIHI